VISEHEEMLNAIKDRDADRAAAIMAKHLQGVVDFAKEKIAK
jgi:DNA-binding GntR family transcriptional regulator